MNWGKFLKNSVGVGWVMQGWGGSCRGGVGYVGAGVSGLCRGGVGFAFFSNLHSTFYK